MVFTKLPVILSIFYLFIPHGNFFRATGARGTPSAIPCLQVVVANLVIRGIVYTVSAIFISHVYLFTPIYKTCHEAQENSPSHTHGQKVKLTGLDKPACTYEDPNKRYGNSGGHKVFHLRCTHFPVPFIILTSG